MIRGFFATSAMAAALVIDRSLVLVPPEFCRDVDPSKAAISVPCCKRRIPPDDDGSGRQRVGSPRFDRNLSPEPRSRLSLH